MSEDNPNLFDKCVVCGNEIKNIVVDKGRKKLCSDCYVKENPTYLIKRSYLLLIWVIGLPLSTSGIWMMGGHDIAYSIIWTVFYTIFGWLIFDEK